MGRGPKELGYEYVSILKKLCRPVFSDRNLSDGGFSRLEMIMDGE